MIRFSFVLISLVFLFSCNDNRVYKEHQDIPDYIWDKTNQLSFEIEIEDAASPYAIIIDVRHAQHYMYKELLVTLDMIAPSGDKISKDITLPLRDEEGKFNGKGAGDIWDKEIPVFESMEFPEPGTYTFVLRNNMPEQQTVAVMAMGLIIDKLE